MKFALLAVAALTALSGDWPRFRGPNGSGVGEGNPPAAIGPSQNVAWRVSPPAGKSSPVVFGGQVILTGHEGSRLLTVAYDAATGTERWRAALDRTSTQKRHKLNDPAAATASTDGRRVVVFFPEFGVAAYSMDGRELWRHALPEMSSMQGVATSPVLEGDSVYLVVDQARGSYALALEAATGKRRWRVERPDAPGGIYSTPIIFRGGAEPVLGVVGDIEFSAYSLATGERVWWVSGLPSQAKTSPAVVDGRIILAVNAMAEPSVIAPYAALRAADADGDGRLSLAEATGVPRAVFPTVDANRDGQIDESEWTRFREQALQPSAALAIVPKGRGDLTASAVVWRAARAVPNVPSPLAADGYVYTVRDGGLAGIFDAATGKTLKEFRLAGALGSYYASPVAAGGHIYFASMEGKISVLAAGPNGTPVSTSAMEEEIFATPAIAGDALYLRTQQALYCFRSGR